MAAVFALVFLPALAGVGFMVKGFNGTLGVGSVLAIAMFIAMSSGVFYGLLRMARQWESDEA